MPIQVVKIAVIHIYQAEIEAPTEEEAQEVAKTLVIENGKLVNKPKSVAEFDYSDSRIMVEGEERNTSIF